MDTVELFDFRQIRDAHVLRRSGDRSGFGSEKYLIIGWPGYGSSGLSTKR